MTLWTPESVWVVIPVKPFREGKSRLAGVLNPEERERLNRWLLQHVLRTVQAVESPVRVLVVSRDPGVLSAARQEGAQTLLESGATTLNRTLQRTVALLRGQGMQTMLVLPADLPRVTAEDVQLLLEELEKPLGDHPGRLVIAPDHLHQGTNALGLAPADEGYTFAFGPGSFYQHIAQARRQGRFVQVVDRPGLAYDLDLPEDLHWVTHVFPQWQARVLGSLLS